MESYSNGSSSESRLLAALCYLILLIVPALVLATDLRKGHFLRYHAYQGLAAGVVLAALYLLIIPGTTWFFIQIPCLGWVFACLAPFVYLAVFAVQLFWAYMAYQGQLFSIPILGPIATSAMGE